MIKLGGLGDVTWHDDAACAKAENAHIRTFFFSKVPKEKYEARNLCYTCPVRSQCLQWALNNKQIDGVWGGKDEGEIRRALSLSFEGLEIRRKRFPNCPFCGARPNKLTVSVEDAPGGGRWTTVKIVKCEECKFNWRSRTSANAVEAYISTQETKKIKAAKEKDEKDKKLRKKRAGVKRKIAK